MRAADGGAEQPSPIQICLDDLLAERGMTLTALAEQVGITVVNLSILKNGRARAIRFSTLARLCDALRCQPGDLLSYAEQPGHGEQPGHADQPGDQDQPVTTQAPATARRAAEG